MKFTVHDEVQGTQLQLFTRFGLIGMLFATSMFGQNSRDVSPVLSPAGQLQNHPDTPEVFPNFAQMLTEQELKRHPDTLVVAFHAQIPGETINRVVAINRAQWDKFLWRPSDEIDTDTAKTQKTIVQVIPETHRMEVHMPLRSKTGETIATLVCVWNFRDEEEAPELMKKSQAIRDEIAPQITSLPQLLGRP